MAERQALGIDFAHYARKGGVNFDLAQDHVQAGVYDFLIIQVGLGTNKRATFDEQKRGAERHGIPHSTYHFLTPDEDMRAQARSYVDWVGSDQQSYILDIETPYRGSRPPNRDELLTNIDELQSLTGKAPILYSRLSILGSIDFLDEAGQFDWWLAHYVWDLAKYPAEKVQYRYFHDFVRDRAGNLPPNVSDFGLEDNVILWQFSEKGKGPHYIFNQRTADPRFPIGKKSADLNISIAARTAFMEMMFADVPVVVDEEEEEVEAPEPTYPGMTNQDMVNVIFTAAGPFTDDPWSDWIVPAGLTALAVPAANRRRAYTGPRVEDWPNLGQDEKNAVLAVMNVEPVEEEEEEEEGPTYPGMRNQDMINLIFRAAGPFTDNPWNDWIVPANLEHLAVPEENRDQPYTGPKVEALPNLSDEQKNAILAQM